MKFAKTSHEDAVRIVSAPMIAKQMGNDHARPLRADWQAVKDDIMRCAVRAKFAQHTEICAILLETGSEN